MQVERPAFLLKKGLDRVQLLLYTTSIKAQLNVPLISERNKKCNPSLLFQRLS
jgi:hypothetical protein